MKAHKSTYITAILTEEKNWVIAEDVHTHVTTQGKDSEDALNNLREAVSLYLEETATTLPNKPPHVTLATLEL